MAHTRNAFVIDVARSGIQLNEPVYRRRKRIFAAEIGKLLLELVASEAPIFGRDIDLAIVAHTVGLIALGTALKGSSGTSDYDDLNVLLGDRQRGATAYAISEATGIPRTTVLRKLHALTSQGMLKETPSGFVFVPGRIQTELVQGIFDLQAKLLVKTVNALLAAGILEFPPEAG